MIIGVIVFVILLFFAGVALVGAPYVPTHKAAVEMALNNLPLKKGDVVVDLGSGDGIFLIGAAKRGLKAIGYEINPFLWLISWLRGLRFKKLVKVKLANFWTSKLPENTAAVFVFGAGPYMKRLAKKLRAEAIGKKQLYVVSYGFKLPELKPQGHSFGLYYYKIVSR